MKKLLKLVSIILVMAMILPMTPIEIFAVESAQTQTPTSNPDGTKTYTVSGYMAATADGSIGENEYSVTAEFDAPVAYSTDKTMTTLGTMPETDGDRSEEMSMSFSQTEDKIYIGIYDVCIYM